MRLRARPLPIWVRASGLFHSRVSSFYPRILSLALPLYLSLELEIVLPLSDFQVTSLLKHIIIPDLLFHLSIYKQSTVGSLRKLLLLPQHNFLGYLLLYGCAWEWIWWSKIRPPSSLFGCLTCRCLSKNFALYGSWKSEPSGVLVEV